MAQPESDGSELEGCRLLFAEDNMTVALSLGLIFETHGRCVYKAARCAESLALIETQAFDVALLDAHCRRAVYPAADALEAGASRVCF